MRRKTTAFFAAFAIIVTAILWPVTSALADTTSYVSLGADLSTDQRAAVLSTLGVTEDELDQDTLVTVTNEDEHRFLDGILSSSVIGSRALSSCKVEQRESGYGIHVETHNITYVTPGMFENALATAGMKDADVVVAGPTPISGTAALVGAMQAYAKMRGTVLEPEVIEAATQELVTSGELAEFLGDSAKTEQLIAAAKQVVAEMDLENEAEIREVVTDIAGQLGYTLDESEMQMVVNLMRQLAVLDLDPETLAEQAQMIYQAAVAGGLDLSSFGIDAGTVERAKDEMPGIIGGLLNWFGSAFTN